MKMTLLILPLLAACQAAPTATADGRTVGGDACGASQFADKVGGPMGNLRYPPGRETRLINPGEMMTMEFNPERLNVEIDKAGRVVAITCG